ncbi:signal recognition particle protein [bacterium]|nr:MAG: signal recognition particle protein [bacterium]
MFESLSDKLSNVFKALKGRGKLGEADVEAAMREVRMALLEADVNYKVVKDFVEGVKVRALGQEVARSLTPGQTVVKIVREELARVMGEGHEPLDLRAAPPVVIMMVGLQGSGKTTTSGKLALYLKKQLKREPYLVPADVYRPAAIEQLKKIGSDLKIPVFDSNPSEDPVAIAKKAFAAAKTGGYDTLILDTAGRLHIDAELMDELRRLNEALSPREILFVADAMTGQDAVNVAKEFDAALGISGVVLTKTDGDARGGAALSIKAVTQKPVKFLGVGEKSEALEPFHPDRMAARILGMGDVLSIIEKAGSVIEVEDAQKLEQKLLKNTFTLEDFKDQLVMVRKMGGIDELMGKIPGVGKKMGDVKVEDKELVRIIAIINSMTPAERKKPDIINPGRKRRIAAGSGTRVEDVNRLLNKFRDAQAMMKKMSGLMKGGGKLAKLFGKGMGKLPFPM